ncbi:MAG TPA: protein phosphatase 2C domain-containing protein [Polyangiaceae bacterium]|nr:protein phosphatase 2C domain-containing protein [Polyangiaceae bacterium]
MPDGPIILASASPYGASMEDRSVCDPELPLFAVLDGESEGGIAAQIAADTLLAQRDRFSGVDSRTGGALLEEALQLANCRIFEEARRERWSIGGTTCTACTIAQGTIVVAHVGDGRLYVARDRAWHRVTLDHTLREDVDARAGLDAPDLVPDMLANVVTRALGVVEHVRIDLYAIPLQCNVALLLCTDGAWHPIDPFGAPGCIPFHDNLQVVGDAIMQQRFLAGARDDATVLIARCGDGG